MEIKIQLRRDTSERWKKYNPTLLNGEIGLITDNYGFYKIGDGVHTWSELPILGSNLTLDSTIGDSTTSVMTTKAVSDYIRMTLSESDVITDFTYTEGYMWDGERAVSVEYPTYKHTSKINVSTDDYLIIRGKTSFVARLVSYYSTKGRVLKCSQYPTSGQSITEFSLYCWEDGYIVCNSLIDEDLTIYKASIDGALSQTGHKLRTIYGSAKPYAMSEGTRIELDTSTRTLTIPSGCKFWGNNLSTLTIDEDIIVSQSDVCPNWSSSFLFLNTIDKTVRCLESWAIPNTKDEEFLVCLVKWDECIYTGNFKSYILDGKVIDLKPTRNLFNDLCVVEASKFDDGFYSLIDAIGSIPEVGTVVDVELPLVEDSGFKSYHFVASKGSTLTIYGLGGSDDSRLYCIINRDTKEVVHIAESGEDTRTNPKIIEFTTDCDVYVSISGYEGKIEYITSLTRLASGLSDSGGTIHSDNYLMVMPPFRGETGGIKSCMPELFSGVDDNYSLIIKSGTIVMSAKGWWYIFEEDTWISFENNLFGWVIMDSNGNTRCAIPFNIDEEGNFLPAPIELADNEGFICAFGVDGNYKTHILAGTIQEYICKVDSGGLIHKTGSALPNVYGHMRQPPLNFKKPKMGFIVVMENSYIDYDFLRDMIRQVPDIGELPDTLLVAYNGEMTSLRLHLIGEPVELGNGEVIWNNFNAPWDGGKLKTILKQRCWDAIFIDATSEKYCRDSYGFKEIIRLIKSINPGIAIGLVSGPSFSTDNDKAKREWEERVTDMQVCCADLNIDMILPFGTAIQNLRSHKTNFDGANNFVSDDGKIARGAGQYAIGCTVLETLFAPRLLDDSSYENISYFGALNHPMRITKNDYGDLGVGGAYVTDDTALTIQRGAVMAVHDWTRSSDPDTDVWVGY